MEAVHQLLEPRNGSTLRFRDSKSGNSGRYGRRVRGVAEPHSLADTPETSDPHQPAGRAGFTSTGWAR
jgi:hypothetical protein